MVCCHCHSQSLIRRPFQWDSSPSRSVPPNMQEPRREYERYYKTSHFNVEVTAHLRAMSRDANPAPRLLPLCRIVMSLTPLQVGHRLPNERGSRRAADLSYLLLHPRWSSRRTLWFWMPIVVYSLLSSSIYISIILLIMCVQPRRRSRS